MRGIGKGQTIEFFVIPEVMRLVNDQQLSQAPETPAPQSQGGGLLSLAFNPGQASHGSGKQLLINVAAWLTVNGMKSENMQFRMLCQQSIDNVSRKRAFGLLSTFYKELTQVAFSGRAKEITAQALMSSKGSLDEVENDLDLESRQSILFEEDYEAILQVVQSGVGGA